MRGAPARDSPSSVQKRETRLFDELASGFGQRDNLVIAHEKQVTEFVFEFLNSPADRGLFNMQSRRSSRKTEFFGKDNRGFEQSCFW
jgi:hypothetical protein